jgi:hypothetical protein
MNKIKISHESPLCLLERSRLYNDYDYALVHLFEKYPKYYDFFVQSLKQGREVILDNSIFELGTAFDSVKFASWIDKLKPTYYIVPDALENVHDTIEQYKTWLDTCGDLPGKKIGVVQGKNYTELIECYRFMTMHADVVAISFDYSYFELTGAGLNREQKWSSGRPKFLRDLCFDGIYNPNVPIHLLGCSLPIEYMCYRNSSMNILSVDTSNPVLHGMHGIKYGEYGLQKKYLVKMVDVFEAPLTPESEEIINFNIKKFREIVHGI